MITPAMRAALLTTADDCEAFAEVVASDGDKLYCNYRDSARGHCLLCAATRGTDGSRAHCDLCPINCCVYFVPPGADSGYGSERMLSQPARVAWWRAAAVRLREIANETKEG